MRVWTEKSQERAPFSTTGPLALCGFIKRNDNHISDFLSAWLMCPWATLFSPFSFCLQVHLLETKAKPGSFYVNLRSGAKTPAISPLWNYIFMSLCQWELKKMVLSAVRQSADLSLCSILNRALKIALMFKQFTQTALWLTLYAQVTRSLLLSLWVTIRASQLSPSSVFVIFPASIPKKHSKKQT